MRAPVVCEPLVALAPDQAPEAEQEVALLEDQANVELAPLATVLGLALNVTWAVGADETVTETDWTAEPPLPWQDKA